MKLISCHIENFGKLSDKDFDFNAGLTSLCEPNGYGKTTLAAFVRAMFYGLPATRANSKEFDDRQRYYPFNGGKFGGNITVERGGKVYKIVRFFGKKSATGDECTVYVDGEPLPEPPESIGRELFGIDESAFMRTVFVTSADTEISANGSINAKLNSFVDDTDEGNNFETAKKILDEARKKYKADRGGSGLIPAQQRTIAELENEIRNLNSIGAGLDEKYVKLKKLSSDAEKTEAHLKAARERNSVLDKWNTYETLLSDADGAEKKFTELNAKRPSGFPEEQEIETLSRLLQQKTAAENKLEGVVFTPEKSSRLSALRAKFKRIPEAAELSRAFEKSAEIARLSASVPPEGFGAGLPEEEDLSECREKLEKLRGLNRTALSAAEQVAPQPVKKSRVPLIAAIAGGALFIAGIALLFVQSIAGGICMGLGGAALIAAGFLYFKGQINAMRPVATEVNTGVQAEISRIENEVASFLAKYGYYTEGGVELGFANLVRDIEEYRTCAENYKKSAALYEEVKAFLSEFGETDGDMQEGVISLKSDLNEFKRLDAEYAAANAKTDELKGRIAEAEAEIAKIFGKYGIHAGQRAEAELKALETDRAEAARLKESAASFKTRAEKYRADNKLTEKPDGEQEDIAGLEAQREALRQEYNLLNTAIEDDESQTSRLPEKLSELERVKELKSEYDRKYENTVSALKLLERAEHNLKERYVAPIKEKFLAYSLALEKALGEKVSLDKNFRLTFERGGEQRSDKHLSAGQKSLSALCMRLALIDNMYPEEIPFIIMDDPFVNLDKAHMKRAAELLKNLSDGRQIIYFCCHESRIV